MEQLRQDFETYMKNARPCCPLVRQGDGYEDYEAQRLWEVYQKTNG